MSWASSAPPTYAQSQSPPATPYVNYNMQIQAAPSTAPGGTPIDQVKHFVNTNRRLVLIVVVVVVIAAAIIIGVVLSRSSGSKELGPPGPNYIQDACTNFYHFACDPWLKSGPTDQHRWYSPITRNNIANTRALFSNVATLHPAVQSLSRSCNDQTGVAAAGITPLLTYLAKVTSATTWAAYFDALGSFRTDFLTDAYVHFEQLPIDRNTNLYVLQGGLTLDKNLYSNQARMNQYQSEIARAFRVFGDSSTIAATNAASVVQHEIALLNIMQSQLTTTPVVSSWSSLQSYTGTWMRQYLQGAGYPLTDGPNFRVTVYTPQYFSALQSMFTGLAPSNQHIQYGRWRLINTTSAFLSYPTPTNLYDSASGGFSLPAYERFRVAKPIYMRPPEPRVLHTPNTLGSTWSDYCESVIQLDELTNDAFGSSFINRTMSTQAQTYVSGMVQQILNTFSSYVRTLDWADSASRDAFVNKIANMNSYVAGPTPAPGYAGIQSQLGNTGASFFENTRIIRRMQELNRFSFQNLPWDNKLFWQGPASTVNAYYFAQGNAMFLFAGIMQQPAFQYSTDPYVTLRNMAWLYFIGHEAGHGFDTNGIQFNARGLQTSSWISSSTRSKFSSLLPCVISSYSGLSEFGVTVDGRNTINENIADIIGVRVITKIYKDWQASNNVSLPANFQPQVLTMDQFFWTLIAQNQCEVTNAATLRWQRVNDVHSPGHARANGPAANMEEFGLTFGCRQGEDMYPHDQCFIY